MPTTRVGFVVAQGLAGAEAMPLVTATLGPGSGAEWIGAAAEVDAVGPRAAALLRDAQAVSRTAPNRKAEVDDLAARTGRLPDEAAATDQRVTTRGVDDGSA